MTFSEGVPMDPDAVYRQRALSKLAAQERAAQEAIDAQHARDLESRSFDMRRAQAERLEKSRQQLAALQPLYQRRDDLLKAFAGPFDEFVKLARELAAAENQVWVNTPIPHEFGQETVERLRRSAGLPTTHDVFSCKSEVSRISEHAARAVVLNALTEEGLVIGGIGMLAMS